MSQAAVNFDMIVKRRDLDGLLVSVNDLFKLTRQQRTLLRAQEGVGKPDPEVQKVREDLDALLSVVSLLEIGNISNALPTRMPRDLNERVLNLLDHPEIKYYYHEIRHMLLVESLRRRLAGEQKLRERDERKCLAIFMGFAHSEEAILDPEVEDFGRLLSGRLVGQHEYDMVSFLRVFDDVEGLWARMSRPPEQADALDRSLQGFQRFYAFSRGFSTLLEEARTYSLLQSSMWHYHGFWFKRHAEALTSMFDRFSSSIVVWAGESEDEKAAAAETAFQTKSLLGQLTDDAKYGAHLRMALQQAP